MEREPFPLDPSFLLKGKMYLSSHNAKLKQKYKRLSCNLLSEGFSQGAQHIIPRVSEGQTPAALYSQVRDAWRLHLREGSPVGAEGGRAVNQRAVLSQALGRRDAESVSPGPPHPPSANARGCPHIRSQNQTRALPWLRGQAFWGLLRTLFLVSAHCVDRTWSLGSSWLCLCYSPASFLSIHCLCHCPLRAFLCSSLLSRASPQAGR